MALISSRVQSTTTFRTHRASNSTEFDKTLLRILKSCANTGDAQMGMCLHSHMTENNICLETFLGNSLLNLYVKCGQLEDAANLLSRIPKKNSVSWTVMITCYTKHGLYKDALNLYREMDLHNEKPDPVTIVCLLNASISEESLKDGKSIHATVCKHQMEMDVVVGSCVINMYAEHGYLAEARLVFDRLPCRNVVTWTSMITAYSLQGFAEEALFLFQKVQHEGAELDQVKSFHPNL